MKDKPTNEKNWPPIGTLFVCVYADEGDGCEHEYADEEATCWGIRCHSLPQDKGGKPYEFVELKAPLSLTHSEAVRQLAPAVESALGEACESIAQGTLVMPVLDGSESNREMWEDWLRELCQDLVPEILADRTHDQLVELEAAEQHCERLARRANELKMSLRVAASHLRKKEDGVIELDCELEEQVQLIKEDLAYACGTIADIPGLVHNLEEA